MPRARRIVENGLKGIASDIRREARQVRRRFEALAELEGEKFASEVLAATPTRTGKLAASVRFMLVKKSKYADICVVSDYYGRWVDRPGSIPRGHPLVASKEVARDRDVTRDAVGAGLLDLMASACVGYPPNHARR